MNDVGELVKPDVVILLIGERPGLGRAESMSAYMGYNPSMATQTPTATWSATSLRTAGPIRWRRARSWSSLLRICARARLLV